MAASAGREPYRPQVLHGRAIDPQRADEILVNEPMARLLGLRVGDRVTLETLAGAGTGQARFDPTTTPHGPAVPVTVVGIVRSEEDVSDRPEPAALLSAALVRERGSEFSTCYCRVTVRADPSATDRVMAALRDIYPNAAIGPVDDPSVRVDNAIDVQVGSLYAFAGSALVAGLIVIGQALARHLSVTGADRETRRSLGVTRRQLAIGDALAVAPSIAAGVGVAVLVAVVASQWLPTGVAGQAEPSPGVRVDALVLSTGAVGFAALVAALAVAAGWWSTRRPRAPFAGDGGRWSRRVGVGGPATRLGVNLALDARRSGRTGQAAAVGMAIAIAGMLAALGVPHAVDHLFGSPRAFGAGYDAMIEVVPGDTARLGGGVSNATTALGHDAAVASVARLVSSRVPTVDVAAPSGESVATQLLAVADVSGNPRLTMLDGHPPGRDDEVVVGQGALHRLDAHVGDVLQARTPDTTTELRVVGVVLFDDVDTIDQSFLVSPAALRRIDGVDTTDDSNVNAILVAFQPNASRRATIERLRRSFPTIEAPRVPSIVDNLDELGALPYLLAGFFGLLGIAALAHSVGVTLRRRGHDIAVCRALGFRPPQVRGASATYSVTLLVAALVIGVPAGILLGRAAFAAIVRTTHAVFQYPAPLAAIVVIVPGAVMVALIVALVPAAALARRSIAAALRAE